MSRDTKTGLHNIAFYNIENLFDTEDDAYTNDNDFLPNSRKRWTEQRYHNKLKKIGSVIAAIGDEDQDLTPSIIGLAEVENKTVLRDLLEHSDLKELPLDFVHFDSSDERGIDVALLYDTTHFELTEAESIPVYLEDEDGSRDYTRDILHVQGVLSGRPIHVFVNHWPSRRDGPEISEPKRLTASHTLISHIQSIYDSESEPLIFTMGDFNDNPSNLSVTTLEEQAQLFNPFKVIWSPQDKGSLSYDFEWNQFDQIMFSHRILNDPSSEVEFLNADIFDERFVTRYRGKYKGQPFRTYVGKKYLGGYSDHFPVFISLKFGD